MKKRLFLFPEIPSKINGYCIAVMSDFKRYEYRKGDVLIFFTTSDKLPLDVSGILDDKEVEVRIVKRDLSLKYKIKSLLYLKHPSMFYDKNVKNIKQDKYCYVFCGDSIFYPFCMSGLKSDIYVMRFHNLWQKILVRKFIKDISLDIKLLMNLIYFYFYEKKIIKDTRFKKIFISDSDKEFYTSITGNYECETWEVIERYSNGDKKKDYTIMSNEGSILFVYFGTVSMHMKKGIDYFIEKVIYELKKENIKYEFHLYGMNSEHYNDELKNVYAHGIYKEDKIPLSGNALFINPDIIGGGIKLKVQYMIENELYFISTPYGMDGYEKYKNNERVYIEDLSVWCEIIKKLIKK
jgi:hypothetical protein